MDSAILTVTRLRKCRRFFAGVGLAISLSAVLSYGQAATVLKNESQPGAGDDALVPLTSGPPLTAREEEMLRLIRASRNVLGVWRPRVAPMRAMCSPRRKQTVRGVRRRGCWRHRLFLCHEWMLRRVLRFLHFIRE